MELENTLDATAGPGGVRQAADEPGELSRGTTVGRFVLLGTLGAGGMGVVYAAYDPELDRKVALKLLLPRAGESSDTEGRTRLVREAQALAKLSHPNVVAVHDVGTHGERVWIAMEFVAGETLTAWAKARPRQWSEILPLLADAARGVAAAHGAGLVHRDLKPDNVMIGRDGRVRVMDFGLAHGRSIATTGPELATTLAAGTKAQPELAALALRLTAVGSVQGTPAYMAPEQWHGQEAEPATDQFGWSVMAWELLYGERPFAGETMMALAAAVLAGQLRPPPKGASVPRWLRRVIERGLATEPGRRWLTMAALLSALEQGKTRARVRTAAWVVTGVALLGAGVEGYRRWDIARRVAVCEATGADIDRAWNDDAQQRLRDAFAATGVSYAQTAAEKVIPRLDEQAGAWRRARTEVCLNADVRSRWGEDLLDRAVWCLEDREMVMASLVAEFGRANPTTVQESISAVASLRAVDTCLDEGQLQRQPPPPKEGREVIREIRGRLSKARSLALAGSYQEGLTLARQAREQAATGLDWPRLLASARALEGDLLELAGAYDEAEAASTAAYFEAALTGNWDVAAEAATTLISIVGSRLARDVDGRAWAQHAEVALMHAGDWAGLREAQRLSNLAAARREAGAYAEARTLHERALAIREQTLDRDHPDIAASLAGLAVVHAVAGEYTEARALQERALAIRERALGKEHPDVATSLNNLANVAEAMGAYAEAVALHERALTIWEQALGPRHPAVAASLSNLASVLRSTGANAEARALHERALTIREQALGPRHPDVASSLIGLATVLHATGAIAEARELLERALAIQEQALGPDHPATALTLDNLATVTEAAGANAEAVALYERALAIREKALGPDHPDVGDSVHNLGILRELDGAYAEAAALYERALAIREKALGPDHPDTVVSLNNLASVYLKQKRPMDALPLLERALAIVDANAGIQLGEYEVNDNLARALLATGGDVTRALALARRARDGFREAGEAEQLAAVEKLLAEHGDAK